MPRNGPRTRSSKRRRRVKDDAAADDIAPVGIPASEGIRRRSKRRRVAVQSNEKRSKTTVSSRGADVMEVEMEGRDSGQAAAPAVRVGSNALHGQAQASLDPPSAEFAVREVSQTRGHLRIASRSEVDFGEVASRLRQLPDASGSAKQQIVAPNPPPPTPDVKSPLASLNGSTGSNGDKENSGKKQKFEEERKSEERSDFVNHTDPLWKDSMRFLVVIFEMLFGAVLMAQDRPLRASHTASIPRSRRPFLLAMAMLEILFAAFRWPLRMHQVVLMILVPVFLSSLPSATALRQAWSSLRRSPRTHPSPRIFPHLISPAHVDFSTPRKDMLTEFRLRDFLQHDEGFHLSMAPAFFGFYAYFGALAAWDEHVISQADGLSCLKTQIKSVTGASAGAMAAVLLSVGIEPRRAAEFCSTITLGKFADPPGIAAAFKGNRFEELMEVFMKSEKPDHSLQLQDGDIPVAVSAFNIRTLEGELLSRGSMSKAARASATFPFLFQPARWKEESRTRSAWFIDGGVTDYLGLNGLAAFQPERPKRVVNLVVGDFPSYCPPGPSSMPDGVKTSELLSISIRNTPRAGPWAMKNGPRAMEAARKVMAASLDLPVFKGREDGHYELHLDASSFVPPLDE